MEEIPQPGFSQTQGSVGYDITLSDGHAHITDINFGNQQILKFNVTGFKWDDLNGNGIRDPGEPGLSGWTIGIGNDTIPYYATTTTDGTGNYSFENVPKGIYHLNETLQPGWKNTTYINQTIRVLSSPISPLFQGHLNLIWKFFTNLVGPLSLEPPRLIMHISGHKSLILILRWDLISGIPNIRDGALILRIPLILELFSGLPIL